MIGNGIVLRPHIDYGACESCGRSVYRVAGGAERHGETHEFRCPDGSGFATWHGVEDVEDRIEQALREQEDEWNNEAEQSAEQARDDGFDEGYDEGKDEGHEAGRKEMHAEIDEALTGVFDTLTPGPGVTAAQYADTLREALASAWNSCAP